MLRSYWLIQPLHQFFKFVTTNERDFYHADYHCYTDSKPASASSVFGCYQTNHYRYYHNQPIRVYRNHVNNRHDYSTNNYALLFSSRF